MTIPQALELALQHHRTGRLADAEALYRKILATQPNHADALHLLGFLANQLGQHESAADLIRKAITANPANLDYYVNLGNALVALGHLQEAIATYSTILQLKPNFAMAHNNLGAALKAIGRIDDAIASYRRALRIDPGYADVHNNLSVALHDKGSFEEAVHACRSAIQIRPDHAEAWYNLGIALKSRGSLGEAIGAYRRALQIAPNHAKALNNLGAALHDQRNLDEAIVAHRQALRLKPDYLDAHINLGNALRTRGQLDEAIAAYRHAIQLKPDYSEAHTNLGIALREQGQLDAAVAAFRRAIQLRPDSPEALNNLGNALKEQGRLGEALAAYRQAIKNGPAEASIHSNLIFTLHFTPAHDSTVISAEHRSWNRQFSEPLKRFVQPYANERSPERRLRLGYVSPDFRAHSVGRYLLPLFERHDREKFEILCYSGVSRPDWMTERLRCLASPPCKPSSGDARECWRNTVGVSDARLAEIIRDDGIDILVDLSLHTSGNRLPMFARQPAPVQVTWLAYPGSSGLNSIGYRLTDVHMDPPGEKPDWSSEEPVRLPDCWCCYHPAGESPEITTLPALSTGSVTFGSLNNFAKVHEGVLTLWAQLLEKVRNSRLLMLCPEGQTRERLRAFFDARRIAADRLELVGQLGRWDYLRLYQRIDLGLDPFPFNGMTTTCDALWMGVPVLTLPGEMPVSRAGLSLLSNVGLAEFAASSDERYVRLAVELAENLPRVAALRATLRARMQASALMDAPRFAQKVEAAYRSIWQRWCNGQLPISRARAV